MNTGRHAIRHDGRRTQSAPPFTVRSSGRLAVNALSRGRPRRPAAGCTTAGSRPARSSRPFGHDRRHQSDDAGEWRRSDDPGVRALARESSRRTSAAVAGEDNRLVPTSRDHLSSVAAGSPTAGASISPQPRRCERRIGADLVQRREDVAALRVRPDSDERRRRPDRGRPTARARRAPTPRRPGARARTPGPGSSRSRRAGR